MATFELEPAPRPTHKTKGLSSTEYRDLLTPMEQILNDKARTNIDGDLAWLNGLVDADDDAAAMGVAGVTYRDLLRTTYKAFDDATSIDCDNAKVDQALSVQWQLGLLESESRIDTIKLGVPL